MSYKDSHKGKDFAKKYDENIGGKFESRIYEIENSILLKILHSFLRDDSKIMDFACGTGRITSLLFSEFPNICGFDISEDMLEIAKKKNNKIQFLKKDIAIDDIDDRFDCITAFRFFLNAESELKKSVLNNLHKLLKPDGILVFNIHMNSWSIAFVLTRIKYLFGLTKNKQNGMSHIDVKRMLQKAGYEMVLFKGYSFVSGNPLLVFLPFRLLKLVDGFLTKITFLGIFSKDLIYVVKTKHNEN